MIEFRFSRHLPYLRKIRLVVNRIGTGSGIISRYLEVSAVHSAIQPYHADSPDITPCKYLHKYPSRLDCRQKCRHDHLTDNRYEHHGICQHISMTYYLKWYAYHHNPVGLLFHLNSYYTIPAFPLHSPHLQGLPYNYQAIYDARHKQELPEHSNSRYLKGLTISVKCHIVHTLCELPYPPRHHGEHRKRCNKCKCVGSSSSSDTLTMFLHLFAQTFLCPSQLLYVLFTLSDPSAFIEQHLVRCASVLQLFIFFPKSVIPFRLLMKIRSGRPECRTTHNVSLKIYLCLFFQLFSLKLKLLFSVQFLSPVCHENPLLSISLFTQSTVLFCPPPNSNRSQL